MQVTEHTRMKTIARLLLGPLLTVLFIGGWAIGAAEGPYLAVRGLIAVAMFGCFAVLGNLAEARGWFDD